MFIHLLVEKDNPQSAVVINVNRIIMTMPQHTEGASPKCALWLADSKVVTVDHTPDEVMAVIREATERPICSVHKAPAVPAGVIVLPAKDGKSRPSS